MSYELIKAVLDGVPHAAIFVERSERVAVINALARELLGNPGEGRHYISVLRQPALLDCVEEALRLQQVRRTRYLVTEYSREATYLVVAAPVAHAELSGVLVSFEDITDREAAGQIRRDFVANVSHELKSPLTAVLGFIETLRGPARNDRAAQERFLDIMAREAERMNRLVQDLLSLSRVESEERVRPAERVEIVALVQATIAGLRPLAQDNGVVLNVMATRAQILVRGDEDQLVQVITNLVENAIKYGKSGGEVAIDVSYIERELAFRGPAVRIDVSDKGDGFDPVHIPRLTERFYRVDGHRSREMGGTGLGLAIVKHIVNRHRGRFRIESTPGQGSRFSVMIPVA